MSKAQATEIIAADGLDWTAPVVDLIDTLTYALSDMRPGLSWDECTERADRMAARWAE